jgi:hypothetical protein
MSDYQLMTQLRGISAMFQRVFQFHVLLKATIEMGLQFRQVRGENNKQAMMHIAQFHL